MKQITTHAKDRIGTRGDQAGFTAQQKAILLKLAEKAARECERDEAVAVKMGQLKSQVGEAWGQESNGNQIWAVIRQQRVVTVMLRRSTQPETPKALRVDRVIG